MGKKIKEFGNSLNGRMRVQQCREYAPTYQLKVFVWDI